MARAAIASIQLKTQRVDAHPCHPSSTSFHFPSSSSSTPDKNIIMAPHPCPPPASHPLPPVCPTNNKRPAPSKHLPSSPRPGPRHHGLSYATPRDKWRTPTRTHPPCARMHSDVMDFRFHLGSSVPRPQRVQTWHPRAETPALSGDMMISGARQATYLVPIMYQMPK